MSPPGRVEIASGRCTCARAFFFQQQQRHFSSVRIEASTAAAGLTPQRRHLSHPRIYSGTLLFSFPHLSSLLWAPKWSIFCANSTLYPSPSSWKKSTIPLVFPLVQLELIVACFRDSRECPPMSTVKTCPKISTCIGHHQLLPLRIRIWAVRPVAHFRFPAIRSIHWVRCKFNKHQCNNQIHCSHQFVR